MRIERGVICQAMKHASTSSFFSLASPLLILTLDDAGSIVTSSYVISNVSSNVYL